MSVTVPISQRVGNLPLGYEFTPDGYRSILLQRLELYLSGDNVFLGNSTDTTAPTKNVGAWFNPTTKSLWAWNNDKAQYEPSDIGFISGNFGITVNASPTAARTLTLKDATGTAMLTEDVAIPKAAVVLTSTSGTVSTIDANVSNNFILILTENSTIPSLTNMASGSGKKIRISIVNDGTAFTVTWPSSGANAIKWPSASTPVQPISSPGLPSALAIYTITEANVGQTYHLWGDPEITGFAGSDSVDTGGSTSAGPSYLGEGTPPPKGRNPYNIP